MEQLTERLKLSKLKREHAPVMYSLMNTPKWKEFIGDRNIQTTQDAEDYIQKIVDSPTATYWMIQTLQDNEAVGIVTFIKRDYLSYSDIGFALLPDYFGKGMAYEATAAILNELLKDPQHKKILATTIPTNTASIKLLERLGFAFSERIQANNQELEVFSIG